jgi:TonB family protein
MRTNILFLLFFSTSSYSQTVNDTITKYFDSPFSDVEVKPNKASYIKKIYKNKDESITTELINKKDFSIYERYTFKDKEPIGIWIRPFKKELNYNFELKYKNQNDYESNCLKIPTICVSDSISNNYIEPFLIGSKKVDENSIIHKINYPMNEEEIEGTVIVEFIVNEKGNIECLYIVKGINPKFDKEVARGIYDLKFLSPAKLYNYPIPIKFIIPIKFSIEY